MIARFRSLFFAMLCVFFCANVFADEIINNPQQDTVQNVQQDTRQDTTPQEPAPENVFGQCAQQIFAKALADNGSAVTESDSEMAIQAWIYSVFQSSDVIEKVLECSDIAALDDIDTFSVPSVTYVFPAGRQIVINYSTQPKILKQRLTLADKRAKFDGLPTAKINPESGDVWTSTIPAWYGILVVQAGALDKYTGKGTDNLLSIQYLAEHEKEFYPHNSNEGTAPVTISMCTTRSAFADDNDVVNKAVHKTFGEEDKTFSGTDYYVAGDVNLQWITWAQVAGDVALTVATAGGGTVVMGLTKAAHARKAARGLESALAGMKQLDNVKDYEKLFESARAAEKAMEQTKTTIKTEKELVSIAKELRLPGGKMMKTSEAASKYGKTTQEIEQLKKMNIPAREKSLAQMEQGVARRADEITDLQKNAAQMAENSEDIKKYTETTKTLEKLRGLTEDLKAWRIPQRGNVIARGVRTLRANSKLNGVIKSSNKIARASMSTRSARIKDYMFGVAMKTIGAVGSVEQKLGLLYGGMKLLGGMYDYSETSTGEFTSNIQFKPICLLSGDNLEGQENIVSHGMWLMWAGDSFSAADDDAAYLQAMDSAAKFHEDLTETQDELSGARLAGTLCDVDIYVVRPVIKNPGTEDTLYYLIMNDVPWSVRIGD